MKKIINEKKYDTDTAHPIGSHWNGFGGSDFRCCKEDLFKKKTGEFFLYGKGGPMSKYAIRVGDSYGYGEMIVPLTEEEAREWAERNLDIEEYEAIFGEVEE